METKFTEAGKHYELYLVTAEITKFFSVLRYPLDDHLLTIRIEDGARQSHQLRFVADKAGSDLSSRVKIPGYEVYDTSIVERLHSYRTRRGDPRLPSDYKATYSQLVYGVWIKRSGWGLYVKMFLGAFASVAIALTAFFIGAELNGPRFSVGIGAFFATIASNYIISRQIPPNSNFGLTDFVSGISLVTVFLILMSSVIAVRLHYAEGGARSAQFDGITLIVFVVGYVVANVVVAGSSSV